MAEPPAKGQLFTLRILWGSMIVAQAIFTGLILFTAADAAANADPEVAQMMLPVLGALALGSAVAALGLGRFMASKIDYMTFCLLRWALAESVGVFGLVLGFMGVQTTHAIAFPVGAVLVLLSIPPGSKDHDRYQQARIG